MIDSGIATQYFTPGSPIQRNDLFSGRAQQIKRIKEAIPSPGIHPVVFGQRGVGKTSLANILPDLLTDYSVTKVTCDSADTFSSIWDRVLRKCSVVFKKHALGFTDHQAEEVLTLAYYLPEGRNATPSDIHGILSEITTPAVIVLDEFDRPANPQVKTFTADLIKLLSDNNPNLTVITVGVGESVSSLIGAHESISRNLRQIDMPKMIPDEIKAIVKRGFDALSVRYNESILESIVALSDGFPHYAHLLGLAITRVLIEDNSIAVSDVVFERACYSAVEDAIESLRDAYATATATSKPSNYAMILTCCGFATHDERGVFRATDVVDAIAEVFGEHLSVPGVVPALAAFTSPERGPVLETVRVAGRNHYRFRDPMMRPFLKIKARTWSS